MSRLAPKPSAGAMAALAVLVAEIRNADLDDTERVDAARLLIREQGFGSVADLLACVAGKTGVLSPGSLNATADAWALEHGLP